MQRYLKKGLFSLGVALISIALVYSFPIKRSASEQSLSGTWVRASDPRSRVAFQEEGCFSLECPYGEFSGIYTVSDIDRFVLDVQGEFGSEERTILFIEDDRFLMDPELKAPMLFVRSHALWF